MPVVREEELGNPFAQDDGDDDGQPPVEVEEDDSREEDEFVWYLTECFAGSRKNNKVVVKKTRPHPVVSSFLASLCFLNWIFCRFKLAR